MRGLLLTPFAVFLLIMMILLSKMLEKDAQRNDSPLIGKDLPAFHLENVYSDQPYLSSDNLGKGYKLINIFASWCLTCRVEHQLLMNISVKGNIPIYGIAWKDKRENTIKWLEERGNPYKMVGFDDTGRVGLDLGITGAPETYLISPDGKVLFRHAGPITSDIFSDDIMSKVK